MKRLKHIILIVAMTAGTLIPQFVFAADPCLPKFLRTIIDAPSVEYTVTRLKLSRFSDEVKRDGIKRFFIKDLPKIEVPSEKKLLGILREIDMNHTHWFWDSATNVAQFLPRKISKAVYKKPFDFVPGAALYNGIERRVLPAGKTLTNGWKMGGAWVLYPLSTYGLYDRWREGKEKEIGEKKLDWLIQNDVRFELIRAEKNSDKARREAFELKVQYENYFAIMHNLHEQGIEYDNPAATVAIFNDAETVKRIGPLFSDVLTILDPKYYEGKPYLDASRLKGQDAQLVHDLVKLNHLRLMVESNSHDLFFNFEKANPNLKKAVNHEFFKELNQAIREKKMTRTQAEKAFADRLRWATRLKMFEYAGVVPYRIEQGEVTSDTLTIESLEPEIIDRAKKR